MKRSIPIPLYDYLRIHRVIRTALDSVGGHTAQACMLFSAAGAAILQQHYKKDATQVVGAALFLVNEELRNVITYATLSDGVVQCSNTAFHAWVECDGHVIDFMAPLYPEVWAKGGQPGMTPSRMFQRKCTDMASSHEQLLRSGDFFLAANAELAADLRRSFYAKPYSQDLINICLTWFRRPPKQIQPRMSIRDDRGEVIDMKLIDVGVSGSW